MKIKIPKCEKTLKKEERKSRKETMKRKNKVTNDELKDLILDLFDEIEELKTK